MASILGVSTSCMIGLDKTLNEKIDFIKSLGVEGIELFGQDLLKYGINDTTRKLLDSFEYKSIHMPVGKPSYGKEGEGFEVLEKIKAFATELDVNTLVFHPLQIENYSIFGKEKFSYGVENMPDGKKKIGYQTVEDMKKILSKNQNLELVFDACHALANNIKRSDFLELEDKMCEVHISATDEMGKNADHRLLSKSPRNIIEKLEPILAIDKPIIIEIESLLGNINEMKTEIKFVKKLAKRF